MTDKNPQQELRDGLQPERGLNRSFFRSELPKVLLVVIAAMLVKSVFFSGPDTPEPAADVWLNAPVTASGNQSLREALEQAINGAPRGFKLGLEERLMFLAYARLRAESARENREPPPEAANPAHLARIGRDMAQAMAENEKPFTLMHIVLLEDRLRKDHPGWYKDFQAMLLSRR